MSTNKPHVRFYGDARRMKDNLLSIKLMVYFDKQVLIPLKMTFTSQQWEIIQDRKIGQDIKNELGKDYLAGIRSRLDAHMRRANVVIDELAAKGVPYSAEDVKRNYYNYTGKSIARLQLSSLFDELKAIKKEEGRALSTLESFDSAKKSIETFCAESGIKDVKITNINNAFLQRYEAYMKNKGKALATVGIYNRVLRSLFSYCIEERLIPRDAYPYSGKHKYIIPAPRPVKEALTIEEVNELISLRALLPNEQKRAVNYWLFGFMSNGMNFKDMALLKNKNINKTLNLLTFTREKTSRERENPEQIQVQLTPAHYKLMEELSSGKTTPDDFIFPILREGDNDKYKIARRVGSVRHSHSKSLKLAARTHGVRSGISYQYARHTFGSVMKINDVNVQNISEALGHTNVITTKRYINSLPSMAPTKITEVLSSVISADLFNS